MDLLITILLVVFAVWLVGVFFGWFQTSFQGGPRNLLLLLLAIFLVIVLLREFGLFHRGRGRLFCDTVTPCQQQVNLSGNSVRHSDFRAPSLHV
jgi:hypothetical protein